MLISLLVSLPLAAPAQLLAIAPPPPAGIALPVSQDNRREKLEAAVDALQESLRSKDTADSLAAIRSSLAMPSKEIAEVLARRGLAHSADEVRAASAEALGTLALEPGRKALESALKRDRKLREKPELMVVFLRSLARHQSDSSVPVLAELSRSGSERSIVSARILCLGYIRSPKSAEALFQSMKKAGPEEIQRHMADYRLSLMMLLGVDRGLSQPEWMEWWNDNRRELKVLERAPRLPDAERERWRRFWGLEPEYPRPEKRRERGK